MKLFLMPARLSGRQFAVVAGIVTLVVVAGISVFTISQTSDENGQLRTATQQTTSSPMPSSTQKTTTSPTPESSAHAEPPAQGPEQRQSNSTVRSDTTVSGPSMSSPSTTSTPVQPAPEIVAPYFTSPGDSFSAQCLSGCSNSFFSASNAFPEATGAGPIQYSMTGLPEGATFNAMSRTVWLDHTVFYYSHPNVQNVVQMTVPVQYTASGPGGNTTLTLILALSVNMQIDIITLIPPPILFEE